MDVAEFEQNILKLAFETDVRITTASVAYYLGVPSEEARPMLDELLEQGVLELESDREGNLYYRVADATPEQADEVSPLHRESLDAEIDSLGSESLQQDGASSSPQTSEEPSSSSPALSDEHLTSVEDDGDAPAITPRRAGAQSPSETASDDHHEGSEAYREGSIGSASREEGEAPPAARRGSATDAVAPTEHTRSSPYPSPQAGSTGGRRSSEAIAGVTRQPAATDARLDTCGSDETSSPVVKAEVSCDPQPFDDSNPVLASCADETTESSSSTHNMMQPAAAGGQPERARSAQSGPSQQAGAGAAAASQQQMAAYSRDDHLEKPEHQPGMSLLLSLILCGTGQIYNGEVSKGIMMMVLCFLLWFVLLGWVVHIWSIVDSVVVAERINRHSSNTN